MIRLWLAVALLAITHETVNAQIQPAGPLVGGAIRTPAPVVAPTAGLGASGAPKIGGGASQTIMIPGSPVPGTVFDNGNGTSTFWSFPGADPKQSLSFVRAWLTESGGSNHSSNAPCLRRRFTFEAALTSNDRAPNSERPALSGGAPDSQSQPRRLLVAGVLILRRGFKLIRVRIHRRVPLLRVGVEIDVHRRRTDRDIMVAHAQEAADGDNVRFDTTVGVKCDVLDLADILDSRCCRPPGRPRWTTDFRRPEHWRTCRVTSALFITAAWFGRGAGGRHARRP